MAGPERRKEPHQHGSGEKIVNAPSGLQMMLKAMGIEFDPKMFKTMTEAVIEIRDSLREIKQNTERIEGNQECAEIYRNALRSIALGELSVDCAAQEFARQILADNPMMEKPKKEIVCATNRS